jgi:hypothetical protein
MLDIYRLEVLKKRISKLIRNGVSKPSLLLEPRATGQNM